MRKIVCLLFISILLASCSSTYFYSGVDCLDERVEKVENGDFLLDNDSLWIAYCFKGESTAIQITVYNKMNKPLYIDWQRSALIVNNVAYPYAENPAQISGSSTTYSNSHQMIFNNVETYSQSSFGGTLELPKQISFIPPKSMITHSSLALNVSFEAINKKSFRNVSFADKNGNVSKVKRIDFSEENTPLAFKSYLTTYTKEDNPVVYQQEFYVKNILKTNAINPKNLPPLIAERGDMFYIEKPADTRFVDGLLGATLLVGVVAVDAVIKSKQVE